MYSSSCVAWIWCDSSFGGRCTGYESVNRRRCETVRLAESEKKSHERRQEKLNIPSTNKVLPSSSLLAVSSKNSPGTNIGSNILHDIWGETISTPIISDPGLIAATSRSLEREISPSAIRTTKLSTKHDAWRVCASIIWFGTIFAFSSSSAIP